jgi:hypothetical protein
MFRGSYRIRVLHQSLGMQLISNIVTLSCGLQHTWYLLVITDQFIDTALTDAVWNNRAPDSISLLDDP